MNLVYGSGVEKYAESIKYAQLLEGKTLEKEMVFHAYWDGELSLLHLISIKTCWYFNVQPLKMIFIKKFLSMQKFEVLILSMSQKKRLFMGRITMLMKNLIIILI